MSKIISGLFLTVLSFLVGRCVLFEMNPLCIGYIFAVGVQGGNTFAAGIGAIVGLATVFNLHTVLKYGILIIIVALLLELRSIIWLKGQLLLMSFFLAVISSIYELFAAYFFKERADYVLVSVFGALVFSSAIIFNKSIMVIKDDYTGIVNNTEAAIGVFALLSAALFGMPVDIMGVFVVAEAVGLLGIMIMGYKFGFGMGMSWAFVSGLIMSLKMDDNRYIVGWIFVSLFATAIHSWLDGGRLLYAFLFTAGYYIYGYGIDAGFVGIDAQKAYITAVVVFILLPGTFMLKVDEKVRCNMISEASPELGYMLLKRVEGLARAFKRIDYTLASDPATGISFGDIGDIIDNFSKGIDEVVPFSPTIQSRIVSELSKKGVHVKSLVLSRKREDCYEVYITLKCQHGKIITVKNICRILEKSMSVALEPKYDDRQIVGCGYELLIFREKRSFRCDYAVRMLSKYQGNISGDNYFAGELGDGQMVFILADGMGNGAAARANSDQLLDALEELLDAGLNQEMSVRLVNSYLAAKNKGEVYSTMDMLIIDLYTGNGRIYKQGAATTFIKRGEWMEQIKSTSLPVGVIAEADCERCTKKFYNNDIIVMVSDGVLENIIHSDKDGYLQDLIRETEYTQPEDIADYLMDKVKLCQGGRMKDDTTIIVCRLVKNL